MKPTQPVDHRQLGDVLAGQGRLEEAAAHYRQAVAEAPDSAEAAFLLGDVLLQLGRLEEAVSAYEQGLRVRPDVPEALSNLGTALLHCGRFDEAIARYEQALALRPDLPQILSNLGEALRGRGRLEEAVARCRQALAIDPAQPDAWLNLGNALQDQGKASEAIACYERALSLRPQFAEALSNLGNAFRMVDRLEDAESCYRQALSISPGLAETHNSLGVIAADRGRFAEAQEHYRAAIALRPAHPGYYLNLGDTKRYCRDDRDLAVLERLAGESAAMPPERRAELHFALAKAYADIEEHERSFRYLLSGNALKRQNLVYDEAAALGELRRIEEVFTPELLDAMRGEGDPSELPVFILGMPRSGTTLIEQVLASHPKVFGAGETEAFGRALAMLDLPAGAPRRFPELVPALAGPALARLGSSYVAELGKRAGAATRITDKLPANFRFVGLIRLALPRARIVHVRRDPVDTCVSCFSRLFRHGQQYSYALPELGRYYQAYSRLMEHWRRVLPPDAMLEIRYEEVVADFETQARRILDYCGLGWDPACLRFHRTERPVRTASAAQVRQPLYATSVGRARPYLDLIGPLLAELMPGERATR